MAKIKNCLLFISTIFLILFFLFPSSILAADQNIVTPIFIVRGREYWRQSKDISELTKLVSAVKEHKLHATWLIQFDALEDQQIVDQLKNLNNNQELGLYIEITRKLADKSFVYFNWNTGHWSAANKIFLSGYEREERQRLIDTSFNYFHQIFGYYPRSYGSWYQDGFTLEYIKTKYSLDTVLGLADQYSTDGYQVWGQYINQPYYVSKKSSLEPALNLKDSTGVVKVLWAPREPTLSYGKDKFFSTFSLQANDYYRLQGLTTSFFESLLKTSTINIKGKLSQAVVGIEVSELEDKYFDEVLNQLKVLKTYQENGLLSTQTLSQFGKLYQQIYPKTSPSIFTQSGGSKLSSYWFTSPFYRAGFFYENGQLELRDLRFYHQNGYRDNDQIIPDPNENLTRVVPATIDDLILSNKLIISRTTLPEIEQSDSVVIIKHSTGEIRLQKDKIILTGIEDLPIAHSKQNEKIIIASNPKNVGEIEKRRCSNEYGGYQDFPCFKKLITALHSLLPDIRYSKLFGQKYLGLKVSPETLFAIRFPNLKVGKFHFNYPLLENFISIKQKTKPNFSWLGKQEEELRSFDVSSNQVIRKLNKYGEENLINQYQKLIFENSYYVVLEK